MAFETGVSTSPSNLLGLLQNRLNTDGWTIVRSNGLAESGSSQQLSFSDPGVAEGNQYNIVAYDSPAATARWAWQPSTGDSGVSTNFYAHTGTPAASATPSNFCTFGNAHNSAGDQGFSGASIAYFFFSGQTPAGARYCHVVVEGTAGVYFHMWFGTIQKAGSFTGGQYATSLHVSTAGIAMWPGQHNPGGGAGTQWTRFDNFASSGSPGWREMNWGVSNNSGTSQFAGLYQGGLDAISQRTPFCPIFATFWENNNPTVNSSRYVIAGHLPDVMQCSMDGREPGEIVTLGSDDWRIFPMHRKTTDGLSVTTLAYTNTNVAGPAPNNDSNLQGLAYRET